ncbi:MAG: phosphoglycerate kinase [Pseudomonadota bacterium]
MTSIGKIKSIDEADFSGKRVLVRLDLNVPVKEGKVSDTTRLDRIVPTLKQLVQKQAKVIVLSHFGRPKGQRHEDMSLKPIAETLSGMLPGVSLNFAPDCIGDVAHQVVQNLGNGQILILENVRFYSGEESNDESFSSELARLGDVYVNDAFSVSHRAHASTAGIAMHLPAFAGPSLMAEIKALSAALDQPKRPVAALVGGAKISTKIPVLSNLIQKVDKLIIGGGMANTFLFAQEKNVGKSLCEPDFSDMARNIMAQAKAGNCEILLPLDAVVAKEFKEGAESSVVDINSVSSDSMILDAGPETLKMLCDELKLCKTLLWNGPLGAFEINPFGQATFALAQEAAKLTQEGQLVTIAGGGDTVAALNLAQVTETFTYVSTAGGAFLEWLEGRDLPGIKALT